ncbi:hypothetical protein [Microbacterium kribbense]|uniref:hypothetical protein n=1 Tax=Microbacterium kribbense TaxID=433645 RepID=UPI0031E17589
MDRITPRQLRALRGVSASVVTTLVAATAHTIGGAGAPSVLLVAIAATLAAPIAVAVIGRRPSLARTALAVLAAQVVFHTAFALFGDAGAVRYTTDAAAGMHAMHMGALVAVAGGSGAPLAALFRSAPMLAAHGVAAAVTIVALHRGEWMLQALGRGIRRLVRRVPPVLPGPTRRRGLGRAFTSARRCGAEFAAVVSRRGPPLPAL